MNTKLWAQVGFPEDEEVTTNTFLKYIRVISKEIINHLLIISTQHV